METATKNCCNVPSRFCSNTLMTNPDLLFVNKVKENVPCSIEDGAATLIRPVIRVSDSKERTSME
nr:unnamed protein product [Callosobruchus chinensis]